MDIRRIQKKDIDECAALFVETFNSEPWNFNWDKQNAKEYLINDFISKYYDNNQFIGHSIYVKNKMVAAAFCHKKTMLGNDELYIDEFYVSPEFQGKNYGKTLLRYIEDIAKAKNYKGVTLLTNKYFPAADFYEKNGYSIGEHVIFMYKVFE